MKRPKSKKARSDQHPSGSTVTIMIAQHTNETEGAASINVDIDGQKIPIPVTPEVRAYFTDQFVRHNPTPLQRRKYTTLMTLLAAAYKAGRDSN